MSNNDEGLRRRRGSTKKGESNRNSTTTATAPYGHRDDDDAELDKPLIQHNNFVDSDEERNERGTHSSTAARGSLRAPDNGPWNRLSCVSFMLNNAAAAANRNGAVYHKAVDVACAVIDKLPDFFSAKLGPKTLENPHKTFVDRFRESFVVTYNKNDMIHLEMVQELYRHFYAICCVDSDPLIDMSGFLSFAHPSEQTFQEKDIISSEYWKMMGFQGTNPGTDFRGGGCLSLLLLLHLFKNRPDLVRSIFVSRETAPNTPPPPRQPSPSSSAEVHYHHPPQFFVSNMENFISATNSQSNSPTGNLFHTCEYPFAIAAINVAMHLMLLLGVERNTTCLATSENISSYSSRLAKQKVVSIVYNDNGNCTAHEEPPGSCRPFLTRMTKEAAGLHSYSSEQESQSSTAASTSANSANRLVEGFDHLAALFETCIAIMHNEWLSIPPRDRNILYFNQLLQKTRAKTEFLLRHAENILEFNKEVEGYQWISH